MICIECKVEKSIDEMSKRHKQYCKKCRNNLAQKKYRQTEKFKLVRRKYQKTEKYKEKEKRYYKTEKSKAKIKRNNDKRRISGYFKTYYNSHPEFRKKIIENRKKYLKLNLEKIKKYSKKYNESNRQKYLARQNLRRAISRKKIAKPNKCDRCNVEAKRIEAHHEDYLKPLNVIWLCVSCHKIEHGKIGD